MDFPPKSSVSPVDAVLVSMESLSLLKVPSDKQTWPQANCHAIGQLYQPESVASHNAGNISSVYGLGESKYIVDVPSIVQDCDLTNSNTLDKPSDCGYSYTDYSDDKFVSIESARECDEVPGELVKARNSGFHQMILRPRLESPRHCIITLYDDSENEESSDSDYTVALDQYDSCSSEEETDSEDSTSSDDDCSDSESKAKEDDVALSTEESSDSEEMTESPSSDEEETALPAKSSSDSDEETTECSSSDEDKTALTAKSSSDSDEETTECSSSDEETALPTISYSDFDEEKTECSSSDEETALPAKSSDSDEETAERSSSDEETSVPAKKSSVSDKDKKRHRTKKSDSAKETLLPTKDYHSNEKCDGSLTKSAKYKEGQAASDNTATISKDVLRNGSESYLASNLRSSESDIEGSYESGSSVTSNSSTSEYDEESTDDKSIDLGESSEYSSEESNLSA